MNNMSAIFMYLAAVAPPIPPPIITTFFDAPRHSDGNPAAAMAAVPPASLRKLRNLKKHRKLRSLKKHKSLRNLRRRRRARRRARQSVKEKAVKHLHNHQALCVDVLLDTGEISVKMVCLYTTVI